jgi:L-lactate dehydrogenase complex protein LldE
MMKHHYTELLKDDPAHRAAATDLAARTYDFSVFLRERLRVDAAPLLRWPEATTYHYPCHARHVYSAADLQASLGGGVSAQILAPSRVDLCCGFGGMFAVDFPEVSDAMLSDKLETLAAAGARVVVCNEGGCALHMSGGAHRRGLPLKFKHLAECLAESLGLLEPDP